MATNVRKGQRAAGRSAAADRRAAGSRVASQAAEPSTGRDADEAARRVPGKNGGTLTPHAPGSNGGVHRGPDLVRVRRNVVRAIVFHALTDEGVSVAELRRTRKHRRGTSLFPTAMILDCAQAYRNIATAAAGGPVVGKRYKEFLTMMHDIHAIMQLSKDEAKGNDAVRQPFPSVFRPETPAASPAPTEAPLTGSIVVDGQEYVEARL